MLRMLIFFFLLKAQNVNLILIQPTIYDESLELTDSKYNPIINVLDKGRG